ncbi:MAG: universal stress protein [Hyphomicrobiaceae bacterium]|nr:universal stress protein [Hyphomicrobiaceae bacterium]
MKSILVPLDQSETIPAVLETSWRFASLFEGTVEGVALRPAFAEIVAPDPIVAVTIPPADWNETEFCRSVRAVFDTFAAAHAGTGAGGARFRWRGGPAVDDAILGGLARVYDTTVVARPGARGARMTTLEAALFDGGRPVLMAPPNPPAQLGETVLIHWNASTETARAIEFALPVLRLAKRVSFVAVEGHISPGPSIRDAIAHLEANGIRASEKTVTPRRGPGEAILAEAAAIGADLLIKGAYTQSRLRQMIFGGATSHILAAAEIPVFFAH